MYMMNCCPCCMRPAHAGCGCDCRDDKKRPGDDGATHAKAACVWDDKKTSHGGIHCHNGHAYKCDDGEWVKATNHNDECSDSSGQPVG